MKASHTLKNIFVITLLLSVSLIPTTTFAKIGVGMGAGEVRLTDPVKPGGIYTLPTLRIFNTGDEITTYDMHVTFHQDHKELRPQKEWFNFDPEVFTIEPGGSQDVQVSMVVPVKTVQGDYFSFIESGPVVTNSPGTSVGVAVATKLFFTVKPANIFQAIGYRISSFMNTNSPWSWIVLGVILLAIVMLLFKRFFSFNIAVRKK